MIMFIGFSVFQLDWVGFQMLGFGLLDGFKFVLRIVYFCWFRGIWGMWFVLFVLFQGLD